jgi:hypothetical protein
MSQHSHQPVLIGRHQLGKGAIITLLGAQHQPYVGISLEAASVA